MIVQPLIASPRTATDTPAASTSTAASPDNVNENEFLQLLVAQIQYQDPTNPTDSTAFVTQLAQFSSLEQLVAIHGDLDNLSAQSAAGTPNSNGTTGGH